MFCYEKHNNRQIIIRCFTYNTFQRFSLLTFISLEMSEGPRTMHHQKVKLAHKRCPRYQDMDGKCIGIQLNDYIF